MYLFNNKNLCFFSIFLFTTPFISVAQITNEEDYQSYRDSIPVVQLKIIPNSKEEVNLKKSLEDFLIKEKLTLEHIKQNKIIIKKFVSYLNLNQYKFSKKEVSDIFNISRSTLYRWLDE